MSSEMYKYDAFISYRHKEIDQFVAEMLHKKMEAFKAPKKILNREGVNRQKISRVFRDQDELPLASNLEDPIVDALKNSEYLVVICSPRLKESMWCKKEIQTFIEMHGRKKVLAVLVEGEPQDSFPEELLYDVEEKIGEDGKPFMEKKPVEPLAADFRGATKSQIKKATKTEILRLLAPMFQVSFDDLKQRHREKRIRKMIAVSTVAATLGLGIGVYSSLTALYIQKQKNEIETQSNLLAKEQANHLSDEAMVLFDDDRTKEAVKLAYQAMTEYKGVKMPWTAKSQEILTRALKVYDGGKYASLASEVETSGILKEMKASSDGQYLLTKDNLSNLVLWDCETKEKKFEKSDVMEGLAFDFLDDNIFYYETISGDFKKVAISSGEESPCDKQVSPLEKYKGKCKNERVTNFCEDENIIYMISFKNNDLVSGKTYVTAVNKKSGKVIYEKVINNHLAADICCNNGYLLLYSASQAVLVNAKTGEKIESYNIDERVAKVISLDNSFAAYTMNGSCYSIAQKKPYKAMAFRMIDCSDVIQFEQTKGGFAGIRENDNRLLFYGYTTNKKASIYDEDAKEPIQMGEHEEKSKELAKGKIKNNSSFVRCYMDVKDTPFTLIGYVDNILEVYDTKTMKLLNTYKDCGVSQYKYYGKVNGNHIFSNSSDGYFLNDQGELVAKIPEFWGLDKSGKNVVVSGRDENKNNVNVAIPVYSKEALLQMAEQVK